MALTAAVMASNGHDDMKAYFRLRSTLVTPFIAPPSANVAVEALANPLLKPICTNAARFWAFDKLLKLLPRTPFLMARIACCSDRAPVAMASFILARLALTCSFVFIVSDKVSSSMPRLDRNVAVFIAINDATKAPT